MKRPGLWNRLALGAMMFCMAAGSLHAGSDGKFAKRLSGKYASATSAQLLDINQIECYFHNTARFGMDPGFAAGCYYPRGQRSLTLGFSAGPWFLGTVGDAYRTAVVYYVSDFQPGSILADGTPDDPAREEYRVWKFEKGEEVPPEALRIGCPDRVLGDQMLFSVTNDLGRRDFVPSDPIGVELQQTSFAFGGQDFLENTIFIQYRIIHKGLETLDDAFFALWFDPDIGQSNDDYAGCDTALGLGFVYNGDGWDDQYQTQVPAMGIDFLLGPLVDSSGDTAVMADGSQIPDKRLVPLSAFFVGAYGVSSQMDMPNTAEKLFNLCSGSGTDGSPWLDPTQGNLPTAFPFNGDPFAGTGWLPGSRMRPKDVQMGLAAGPFSFAPGDTLSLLAGLVAGQGVGSLHSIEVMKYWDEHVQLFAENGFQPPVLPEISARAVSGDQSIMLLWDSSGISYSKFGYRFEGFNIWQGVGGNGPWKKIATFDEVNGVTRIWDRILDPSLGMVVSMPVQEGTDSGLPAFYQIAENRLTGEPLINGRTYHFAVTAYYHNPQRPPFALETAIEDIPVRPGLPILDLTTQSEFGDTVSCTQVAGPPCDGTVEVTVVDPSLITGHSYVLDVEGSAEDPVFSLTDTDAGVILFDRQSVPSGRSVSRMADGLSVRLNNPPPGFNLSRGMYASLGEGFGGFDLEGDPYITGVKVMGGSSFFHGAKPGFDFLGSTLAADEYTDCRIDFWNDDHHLADPISCPWSVCSVYHFLSDTVWVGTGVFPGAAYDTDDPDHPRRVNLCFAESDRKDFFWDPLAADSGNGQGGREYLFVMNSDYTEDPAIFYNETLFGPSLDVNCVLWAMPARRDASPAQEFNIRFWMNHPFESGHRYAFDASGFEALRDEAVTRERLSEIQVFPNPYFGSQMDEQGLRERFVTFTHLPESCTIRVFSISGNLVKTIVHSDGTAFEKWDLSNTDGLTVASALYVVHIQTRYGTRILKLCIINREDPVLRM